MFFVSYPKSRLNLDPVSSAIIILVNVLFFIVMFFVSAFALTNLLQKVGNHLAWLSYCHLSLLVVGSSLCKLCDSEVWGARVFVNGLLKTYVLLSVLLSQCTDRIYIPVKWMDY